MAKHVLVLIHGITPEPKPDVKSQYQELVKAVQGAELPLAAPICQVTWGLHDTEGQPRPDQYLTAAEQFVGSLVQESALHGGQELSAGLRGHDWGVPLLRSAIRRVRESVVLYGLSDAIYYASVDGEAAVRDAVFSQVFDKLEASQDGQIELHIVAHSLGVAVAHDFLYALFGTRDPAFPSPADGGEVPLTDRTRALQAKWRREAMEGRLKLGTFISFASQLPLFVMRKQALVEQLARHEKLDPSVIGIDKSRDSVQWAIFYDSDELLGFATRPLYQTTKAIVDIHMDSGLEPLSAHLGYWHRPAIIERCLDVLRANMR
jgi:hypothetical protein